MSDVLTTLRQWSGTAATNKPADTDVIGSGLADNLRVIQAVLKTYLAGQSSTVVPAAGVADLATATGLWVPVSGNSTITGFGTEAAGIWYKISLTGAPPIPNGANISTPGSTTIVGAIGDTFIADSQGGGVWKIWGYTPAAGGSLPFTDTNPIVMGSADKSKKVRLEVDGFTTATTRVVTMPDTDLTLGGVLGTEVTTTSGTAVDFTGIPSGVKKIIINLNGVSLNGATNLIFQIGDAGGIESNAYNGSALRLTNGATTIVGSLPTTSWRTESADAAALYSGQVQLVQQKDGEWTCVGQLHRSDQADMDFFGGAKSLSTSLLDRVRIASSNGTSTFDAGFINLLYYF